MRGNLAWQLKNKKNFGDGAPGGWLAPVSHNNKRTIQLHMLKGHDRTGETWVKHAVFYFLP